MIPHRTIAVVSLLAGLLCTTFTDVPGVLAQSCSNGAQFAGDVTVPDGTHFVAGQQITKTWRLRNTGSCTWGNGYSVNYVGGDGLGASGAYSLPGSVGRNGTLTLSLDMQAPSSPGSYRATYRLNDADGNYFGPEFWIAIVVDPPRIRVRMAAPVLDLSTPEDEGSARPVRPGDGLGFLQRATERAKTAIAQTKATMHGAGCATPWFEILGAGALVEMPLIDGVILVAVYESAGDGARQCVSLLEDLLSQYGGPPTYLQQDRF